MPDTDLDLISLTADVVSAFVANNAVSATDIPGLISSIHKALAAAGAPPVPETPAQEPAVAIRSSVKNDYIVCLEDGKRLKMLRRYLRTNFNMTPDEYRAKWKLPHDYPMVAPAYADQRRSLAKTIGLGRKKATEAVAAEAPAAKRSARKAAGTAADAAAPKRRTRTAPAKAAKEATPVDPTTGTVPEAEQA